MATWLNREKPTGDTLFDISLGCYANAFNVHKFGANYDIDIGSVPETVWTAGGLYPWAALTTAQTLYLISTNASDTGTIEIEGLDADYNFQSESLTMAGLTATTTANTYSRAFRMSYINAGANAGTVTARTISGTGTVVAQVDANVGQTLMAVYTVPNGYTGYMTSLDVSVDANKSSQFQVYSRKTGQPFQIAHTTELSGTYITAFNSPLVMPAKTDIDMRVSLALSNNTRVSTNFDLVL